MTSKLVWTSDPEEARRLRESGKLEQAPDAERSQQTIRVTLDRKQRAGKTVTIASGFQHDPETLAKLAAAIKKMCGSGGTARENSIEIQGDHAGRIAEQLKKLGYRVKT